MPTRRAFVQATAAFVAAPALLLRGRHAHDLVIRGGAVFDGIGSAERIADVAIAGGRVIAIDARLRDTGVVELDARGLAVAPGFVDIHSHGDGTLWDDPRAESVVRQGITTIVVGQDGGSHAPRALPRGTAAESQGPRREHATFAELRAALRELSPAVNVVSMIGLGTVRGVVVGGDNRPATPAEIARMTAVVSDALAQGARGASSGLEYTPGGFASRDELIAVCRPLRARGLPYATHMRNEDDQLLESIDEAIAIAKGAGCALQISHLKAQGPRNWHKGDESLARIDAAAAAGVDVAFDVYPYLAYQTGLSNLFPLWSRDGSTSAFLARLDSADLAARIRTETLGKVELIGGWDNVLISGVEQAADRGAEGQRLGAYAARLGLDPYELATQLLRRNRGSVGMVGFAMSEENLERALAHPRSMVCSDGGAFAIEGPARRGHPHPRSLGSFPRVLGRYVRERKVLSLPAAIRKMTSMPASRVDLRDRGRLAVGAAADVVVFDPGTIEDRATFTQPFAYPAGVNAVIVNGVLALRDGQTTVRSGRAL